MDTDSASKKYSVGYKKPPKHSRFCKGSSGNLRGRKKKSQDDFFAALLEVLNEKMSVVEDGVRKQIPKMAVLVKQVVNRAASGDIEAVRLRAWYNERRGIRIEKKPAHKVVFLPPRDETDEDRRRRLGARYQPNDTHRDGK